MNMNFKINYIDHIAITAKDQEASIQWYEKVIGLKRVETKEWEKYPIFALSGRSGVAIFPASDEGVPKEPRPDQRIDHFAFNVSNDDFKNAQDYFKGIKEAFVVKDHIHYHSLYLKDPDGHTVELTTFVGDEETFGL